MNKCRLKDKIFLLKKNSLRIPSYIPCISTGKEFKARQVNQDGRNDTSNLLKYNMNPKFVNI